MIDKAEKQIREILKKNNLTMDYTLKFPYAELPDDVKLALSVLKKQGMRIVFTLTKNK